MHLKTWLSENRYTIAEFSRLINYSPPFLSNVISGKVKAGRKLREIVSEVTKGEVNRNDWENISLQK